MKTTFASILMLAGSLLAGNFHAAEPPARPAPAAPEKTSARPASPAPAPGPAPASAPVTAAPATKPTPASAPSSAPAASPDAAPRPAPNGVKGMAREFGEQSKDLLAQRKALLERLNSAKSTEEKQAIIAELRAQQRQRIAEQRERARLIREQMQNSRRGDTGVGIAAGP